MGVEQGGGWVRQSGGRVRLGMCRMKVVGLWGRWWGEADKDEVDGPVWRLYYRNASQEGLAVGLVSAH